MTARPLTGRGVLLIAAGAFLVMLVPNIVLTVTAVKTFSGLAVPNSYVASQSFDADRAAQDALGWRTAVRHADGILRLDLADAAGATVRPATLAVTVGRASTTRFDRALALVETPTGYAAQAPLAPGLWRVDIVAAGSDGTPFRQTRDLLVHR